MDKRVVFQNSSALVGVFPSGTYTYTYNANGNLLTLKRNSSAIGASSHKQIDSLVYSYNANS